MDTTTVLIALLTLLAGAAAGWSFARANAVREVADARAGNSRELVQLRDQLADARALLGRAEAALELEQRNDLERRRQAAENEERMRDAFDSLSAEALRRNNEQFVALAEARLATAQTAAKGDLTERQQAIEGVIAPLRDTLVKVEDQLRTVEKEREGAYQSLLSQVGTMRATSEQLRLETSQLVTALRAPQVRGRWGELQLQRVVEAAGMVEHCDFVQQETAHTADGDVRPDLVVKLAGGKQVVVDAKVAFAGYLEAMEARDEATRLARLRAHARHLKTHVDSLGDKAYWRQFEPTPEFVVCFVPADAFLNAALEQDPTLLEYAFGRNVVIATPSTLIALLRTVGYAWRQEALARNAQDVHKLAKELYGRLATVGGHFDAVGRSLNSAVEKYNKAVASLESRVLVTARKLTEMKVVTEPLEAPHQVEAAARALQAPVLTNGDIVPMQAKPQQGSLLDERESRAR